VLTIVKSHRLLPHERWLADWVVRRQERAGSSSEEAWHWSFGPEGARLLHAAVADMIVGYLLALSTGMVWSTVGDQLSPVAGGALVMAILGVCMAITGTRQLQAASARKAYLRDQLPASQDSVPVEPVTTPRPRRAVPRRRQSPER